jgi:hypothetical protein
VIAGDPERHGLPGPVGYGTNDIPVPAVITNAVASPADESNGVRYVCQGWTGTGSAPAAGTGTVVTFTMQDDATLTWQWRTECWLGLTATNGSILGASSAWKSEGYRYDLTASNDWGYAFDHWRINRVDAGSTPLLSILMDGPQQIEAIFLPVFLDVTEHVGVSMTDWSLNLQTGTFFGRLELCLDRDAPKQLLKPFWYGVKPTPNVWLMYPDGTTNGVDYLDITDAVVAALPGIGNGDEVLDPGECVSVDGIECYSRTRDVPAGLIFAVYADPPGQAVESLPLDTDRDGIPNLWEAHYGLDLNNPFDGDDDPDSDGADNLHEYIADTDPGDDRSILRIRSVEALPHGVEVHWQGGVLATQYIERVDSMGGEWTVIVSNTPPTETEESCVDTTAARAGFYRIRAERE